ncbi:MAG: hypothetical protein COY70_00065, partial [Candidatus Magasanikbacteria bacterium CG_4_10_14_0_8_um_filter_42_12]
MTHPRVKFLASFGALALLLLATPAFAQTESISTDATDALTEDVVQTTDGDIVVVDDTYDDASVETVVDVPSNFGLWWRGIKERVSVVLTVDPVVKAEKELRYAEERRQIFEKMMETADTKNERSRAEVQLARSETLMEKVEARRQEWENAPDATRVEKLNKNIVTSHIRKEHLFDRLEEVVPEDRLDDVQALRLKAQERSSEMLQRIADHGGEIPEQVKLRLEAVKTFIEEKKATLEDFQARKEVLKEELQNMTEEERKDAMQEMNQERRDLNQERVEKTKEILEQRKERTDDLKEKAATGDERAAAALQHVQKVNQEIRDNVQEKKEAVQEKRVEIKEQVQEHRDEMMEQNDVPRPRVTQEDVQQTRDSIRESMRDGNSDGPKPIPGATEVRPLPI